MRERDSECECVCVRERDVGERRKEAIEGIPVHVLVNDNAVISFPTSVGCQCYHNKKLFLSFVEVSNLPHLKRVLQASKTQPPLSLGYMFLVCTSQCVNSALTQLHNSKVL